MTAKREIGSAVCLLVFRYTIESLQYFELLDDQANKLTTAASA